MSHAEPLQLRPDIRVIIRSDGTRENIAKLPFQKIKSRIGCKYAEKIDLSHGLCMLVDEEPTARARNNREASRVYAEELQRRYNRTFTRSLILGDVAIVPKEDLS